MELSTPQRLRLLDPALLSPTPPPGKRAPPRLRLHTDLVSSPSPPTPGKRARLHTDLVVSSTSPPAPAPRKPPLHQAAEKWYEQDIWTEVAKYLDGTDLVRLALTCHWFHNLLFFDEDSIWCYAFVRDLSLLIDDPKLLKFTLPRPSHCSWRALYVAAFNNSHAYSFRQPEKHIEWFRIAGFLVETPELFMTAKLALPPVDDGAAMSIELTGSCLLSNVRPGIWIADINMVRCPPCNIDGCKGTMHVLDARHCELYLENKFRDWTWEYEDLGTYTSDGPLNAATIAICNHRDINTQHNMLDARSWM